MSMKRKSAEAYPGQRGKEKRELFTRFRLRAIEDVYKSKFFAMFNHRCFKCGTMEKPDKADGGRRADGRGRGPRTGSGHGNMLEFINKVRK